MSHPSTPSRETATLETATLQPASRGETPAHKTATLETATLRPPSRPLRARAALTASLARLTPSLPVVLPALLVATAILLSAADAFARPGGGSSFGGGRSSGGGSSGGGGGGGDCFFVAEIFIFLVQLTIEHPVIGIPLDILVVGVLVVAYRAKTSKKTQLDWSTTAASAAARARVTPSRSWRKLLSSGMRDVDPNFSLVLFEDFAYSLFATVHEARGAHRAQVLAPYLSGDLLARLPNTAQNLQRVHSVVIGALRYYGGAVNSVGGRTHVTLEFEANYTEVSRSGSEQAYYVIERWTLSRPRTARARTPETARTIGCPNCGAPLDGMRGNTCSYCNTEVHAGQFDWMVDSIVEVEKSPRAPQLTSDTPEMGTALPTIVDPDARARFESLTRRDPQFSWQRLAERVSVIFAEMQVSWSSLDWSRARPFVSDQLFQMLSYWIETYRRSHMRNVTENARITGMEIASVISDRYYDAITLRVYATGLDYTITDAGKVVSGSRTRERAYTEYWTLIRGVGARTRAVSDRVCPNCGAPLNINMAGTCTSCRAKVTAGEFDWVLSRIEQDEAYG